MNINLSTQFTLSIRLNGTPYDFKVLKCTYAVNQVMYKAAIPQNIFEAGICWIAQAGDQWDIVLGDKSNEVCTAILNEIINLYNNDNVNDLVLLQRLRSA